MKNIDYDPDADAIFLRLHHAKSVITAEITEHILIDMTGDGRAVSLEILDASEEISKLFGRSIKKDEIKRILCSFTQEKNNEFRVQFNDPVNKEQATLIIPAYKSPIIS